MTQEEGLMPAKPQPGLAFRIPAELHDRLRTLAGGRDVSVTAIAEEIVYACANRGANLHSDETVTLVLRPNPELLRETTETITAMIRAGIEKIS
jgi:hypothetical protein